MWYQIIDTHTGNILHKTYLYRYEIDKPFLVLAKCITTFAGKDKK
jgi:hypothetical protein